MTRKPMTRKKHTPAPVDGAVVERLRTQVQAAKALASVPDQDLLADPRLNPHTRDQADDLTAQRLGTVLELEHKRELRRAREADRVEEEAARAAQAVAAANRATDPARSVLALTRARGRYAVGALGASVLLSVGSAMGLDAWVQATWPTAPTGIGYLGEVALTVMATAAIGWRGKLAQAQTTLENSQQWLFAAMIAVPLLASIIGSTAGSGPVGAVCSIGAALFAWFGYLVSVTGSTAVDQAMGRMRARTTTTAAAAVAEDGPAAAESAEEQTAHRLAAAVDDEVAEGIAAAEDYLRETDPAPEGGSGGGLALADPPGDAQTGPEDGPDVPRGDDGASSTEPGPADAVERGDETAPRALEEAARRRSDDAATTVARYYQAHPGAPVKRAARELQMDPKTVRKYRPGGGEQ